MSGTGILIVAVAYLVGSIPFGYLIGRWRGIDVRQVGSGNIGATNVVRATGTTLGLVTFVLDGAKGALVPMVALAVGQPLRVVVFAGFASVFGHCFSVFLSLRGGKGVATFFGVCSVLEPTAALVGAAAFVGSLLLLRYVALSSMALLVTAMVLVGWRHGPADERTVMVAVSVVLIGFRHRGNWTRMWRGTEQKMLGRSGAAGGHRGGS